ncbi:uncharacterized protein [Lolium perenne]|uniref:uncharacterized protein isoform X2 n=1 Tax=Lolium perenne TaxID=4522 RepID=UPI0021F6089A|nr:uncharacterized protein LOC127303734 isoform X2 [Lolium perenne]
MAADFFGDLEPSLQALLAQAGSGGGEAESVVGYSSLPQDAAAAAATVDVGESTSTGSCNSVVGANCTAAAGEGLQADASVAEASDVCERTIVSGWKKRHPPKDH